jgi:hypothetical protein
VSRKARPRRRFTCRDCGETFAADRRNFYVKGYVNGNPRRPIYDSYCRPCRRARSRRWVEAQYADPVKAERLREYHRRKRAEYRRANPEREHAYNAAKWQALKADDEAHAALIDKRRADAEALRRDRASRGPLLDARPLAEWLAYEFAGWSTNDVAVWLGVDATTVHRLMIGHTKRVSLTFADAVFIAADCPHLLNLLYPPEDVAEVKPPSPPPPSKQPAPDTIEAYCARRGRRLGQGEGMAA